MKTKEVKKIQFLICGEETQTENSDEIIYPELSQTDKAYYIQRHCNVEPLAYEVIEAAAELSDFLGDSSNFHSLFIEKKQKRLRDAIDAVFYSKLKSCQI